MVKIHQRRAPEGYQYGGTVGKARRRRGPCQQPSPGCSSSTLKEFAPHSFQGHLVSLASLCFMLHRHHTAKSHLKWESSFLGNLLSPSGSLLPVDEHPPPPRCPHGGIQVALHISPPPPHPPTPAGENVCSACSLPQALTCGSLSPNHFSWPRAASPGHQVLLPRCELPLQFLLDLLHCPSPSTSTVSLGLSLSSIKWVSSWYPGVSCEH